MCIVPTVSGNRTNGAHLLWPNFKALQIVTMADLLMSNNQMIISDPSRSVEYYGNLEKNPNSSVNNPSSGKDSVSLSVSDVSWLFYHGGCCYYKISNYFSAYCTTGD